MYQVRNTSLTQNSFSTKILTFIILYISIVAVGFLYFWGLVFFVSTTILALLKRESASSGQQGEEQNVLQAYLQLLRLVKLPAVFSLVIVLLTSKVIDQPNF